MTSVLNEVRELETSASLDKLWPHFELIAQQLGFHGFVYTIADERSDEFYYFDNIGLHDAKDENFYDPFLDFCCNSYEPMFTGSEYIDDHPFEMPPEAHEFIYNAAEKTGMLSGLSIPIRLIGSNRYGGFNLLTPKTKNDFESFIVDVQETAHIVAIMTQRHVEKLLDKEGILTASKGRVAGDRSNCPELKTLTAREREVLHCLVGGASRRACADQLNLAEGTIATHIKNIYRKLGVHNRVEATKIALQNA